MLLKAKKSSRGNGSNFIVNSETVKKRMFLKLKRTVSL